MLPSKELSSVTVPGEFLEPDDQRVNPLIARELGGIALSDPSQGLQVQVWTAKYLDGNVVVGSDSVSDAVQFNRPNVVEIDLAFDQNMFPAIAFTQLNAGVPEGWLWWFSTLDNQHIFTNYPDAYDLRLTMDDKRQMSSGQNDIILAYLRDNNLYFRAQRDRFGIEYLLREQIDGRLKRFGMNDSLRVQFEILLFKQSPDLILLIPADNQFEADPDGFEISADSDFDIGGETSFTVKPENGYQIAQDPTFVEPKDDKCL